MTDVFVLVPDGRGGAEVCEAADLLARIEDGESFEEATGNAAIDQLKVGDRHETREHLDRVAALNATGDGRAYWGMPPR